MSAKKSSSNTAKPGKKAPVKSTPAHPTWVDMIKECITAHPEEARQGVSRPQIKKFVEDKYKLEIGNAQNTQLSKAIATGAEKGTFVLPKGPSGRVKLPPKGGKTDTSAAKENKPTSKASKTIAKPKAPKTATAKTATAKATTAKKPLPKARTTATSAAAKSTGTARTTAVAKKSAAAKPAVKTKSVTTKKPAPAKKTLAGKKAAPAKKTTTASKRAPAKKAVTGTTAPAKAKAAVTKKGPVKKAAAPKAASSTTSKRKTARK